MTIRSPLRNVLINPVDRLFGNFLPSELPGLKLWPRHNQGIVVTGAGVSQWTDQSGNGNHLLQATDANRPLPGTLGAEEVDNGDFGTNTDDWSAVNATLSVVSEALRITPTQANGQGWATVTTVIGESYLASGEFVGASGGGSNHTFILSTAVGGGGTGLISHDFVVTPGVHREIFTAVSTTTHITLYSADGVNTHDWDNISVKKINASGGILCNGIDQFLKSGTFTWGQPATVYILFNQISWTNGDRIYDGFNTGVGALNQSGASPNIRIQTGASSVTTAGPAVGVIGVIASVFNGASSLIQLNNDTPVTGDAGISAHSGFTLGTRGGADSQFSNIHAYEVAGFSGAHDALTRAKVIAYLAKVGGLSI